jgi:hypothetical protein
MKHILSVDVQKKDGEYTFTLHYDKKTTTFKTRGILEGFEKVEQISMKERESEYEW